MEQRQNSESTASGPPEQPHDAASPALKTGIWASIFGTALLRINGAAIGLMLQTYQADIGASPRVVGFIAVSFYLTELIGAPVIGSWVDRQGWRRFMLLGPLLAAVAVLMTWATVLLQGSMFLVLLVLFFTRLLEGIAVASNTPATLSFIAAATGGNATLRSRISGAFELAAIGGTALGALLGGGAYHLLGVGGFGLLAVFYVASLGIFWLVPNKLPGQRSKTAHHPNPLRLLRQGAVWSFAPAWIAVNGVLGLWLNNFANQLTLACDTPPTPHIAQVCGRIGGQFLVSGYSDAMAGYIFTGFALVFTGGMLVWMRLLPHLRQSSAMLMALSGGLLTCAMVAGINRLQTGQVTLLVVLCLVLGVALMILSGFTVAALNVLMQLTDRYASDRGAMMGIYSVLLGVGQFIGGASGGFFADWQGVNGLVMLTLLFLLLAGGCVWLYRRVEVVAGPPFVASSQE